MTTEIPVDVQIFRAYPYVRELLEQRHFDVSEYPALTHEELSQTRVDSHILVPPILTTEKKQPNNRFGIHSREMKEIRKLLEESGFQY